ncbi:hypothetical protein CEG14_14400 [Bordetella genomosp. 1]|uniref:Uncharacterized protein n=1 Tax=Bordetella genomosp. 1 TaxID=1395607 RepID=A0A261SGN2_9BORD|nr:hypothetical protein [Bordetella genomosp. 1]MDQ8030806.1 hypothetical protein [Bordetella sp.]OZI36211.1 hypothetical protein CEG14_14400 [Bordetella genomosp. 1]
MSVPFEIEVSTLVSGKFIGRVNIPFDLGEGRQAWYSHATEPVRSAAQARADAEALVADTQKAFEKLGW